MDFFIEEIGHIERKMYYCRSRKDIFSNREFCADLESALDANIHPDTVLSLDIFDTLILRDNSAELTRFFEIGKHMADLCNQDADSMKRPVTPVDAFLARHLGTKASYRASDLTDGCREGSIDEIHSAASRILGRPHLAGEFIECELSYESTRILVNPFIKKYVNKHLERGGSVILITDMYMHADHVENLLSKINIDTSIFKKIYSSADTKISKASGGIFSFVSKDLGISPENFFHVGDSLRGDFQQPIRNHWRAMLLPITKNEIELRRKDHQRTADVLKKGYGLSVDIAMPS